ncbi:hypothetical protein [Hymenobacter baengnokdamensis]|uniref:hypothetical protein n=1 Tax=Hymenobacter baengnokdamensis TaxID=2615203 RepID=UPI001249100D|nr:hypothetical protein [Hymenobacter baengnokdamensis]
MLNRKLLTESEKLTFTTIPQLPDIRAESGCSFSAFSMRSFFIVLCGLLVVGSSGPLSSCRSNDPTTGTTLVAGQVVESQTLKPVSGATVQVYHASSGGGYVPVGTGYAADKQGHFSFSFDADSKTGYLVRASAPLGYFTDWAAAPYLTAGRSNEGLVIPLLSPAWVRLQLVDEPPKSQVLIHISGYDGPGDQLNYPRDTTLIRPCQAGFPTKIIWVITPKDGPERQYSQDIKLAALDTITVHIAF